MNTILQMMMTPQFWFGTVIAGILINLASHWLTTKFPNLLSAVSKKWATRTEKLTQERKARIDKMINNPQEQIIRMGLASYYRIMANTYFIFAALFLGILLCGLVLQSEKMTIIIMQLTNRDKAETVGSISLQFTMIELITPFIGIFGLRLVYKGNMIMAEIDEARSREKQIH
jgi:hypothetical protein